MLRMEITKRLDRDIDYARREAQRAGVTILLERKGHPLLEVTSGGDVREIPAPGLRVPFGYFVGEQMLSKDPRRAAPAKELVERFFALREVA